MVSTTRDIWDPVARDIIDYDEVRSSALSRVSVWTGIERVGNNLPDIGLSERRSITPEYLNSTGSSEGAGLVEVAGGSDNDLILSISIEISRCNPCSELAGPCGAIGNRESKPTLKERKNTNLTPSGGATLWDTNDELRTRIAPDIGERDGGTEAFSASHSLRTKQDRAVDTIEDVHSACVHHARRI